MHSTVVSNNQAIENAWQNLASLPSGISSGDSLSWLMRCLERNRDCEYGRRFEFASISNLEQFRRRLPMVTYEDLSHYMRRIALGEADVLFKGSAIAVEYTSGSSGPAKIIPYTQYSVDDFRETLLPWLNRIAKTMDSGRAYWAISPVMRTELKTEGGIPVGMPDGAYLGSDALSLMDQLSVVPQWLSSVQDLHDWQVLSLYFLLRSEDLELISIWSPTFFLTLLDALKLHSGVLCQLLRIGGCLQGHNVPPDPLALQRLNEYALTQDTRVLWPDLKIVSCWDQAQSKPYYQLLRDRLPHAHFQPKGLLSTEGVVSVPDRFDNCLLAQSGGFHEFLADGKCYLGQELVPGNQYEMLISTSGGLYRYRTGDRVVCEGYSGDTPVIQFVGREGAGSDLVGEKLTEEFVHRCLKGLSGFRMLIAQADKPSYVLVLDRCQDQRVSNPDQWLENRLLRNPHYAYARRLGQLGPLRLLRVNMPLRKYMQYASERQGPGNVKVRELQCELSLEIFS